MTLPEKDSGLFEQIDFLDLPREEAEVLVAEYNRVGEGTDTIFWFLDWILLEHKAENSTVPCYSPVHVTFNYNSISIQSYT